MGYDQCQWKTQEKLKEDEVQSSCLVDHSNGIGKIEDHF